LAGVFSSTHTCEQTFSTIHSNNRWGSKYDWKERGLKSQILHGTSLHHPNFWSLNMSWKLQCWVWTSFNLMDLLSPFFLSRKLILNIGMSCRTQKSNGWVMQVLKRLAFKLETEMFMNEKSKVLAELGAKSSFWTWHYYISDTTLMT